MTIILRKMQHFGHFRKIEFVSVAQNKNERNFRRLIAMCFFSFSVPRMTFRALGPKNVTNSKMNIGLHFAIRSQWHAQKKPLKLVTVAQKDWNCESDVRKIILECVHNNQTWQCLAYNVQRALFWPLPKSTNFWLCGRVHASVGVT